MKNKKYKIISEEVIKNLVEFLDEIQFDAAKSESTEDMHKVNFCGWMIKELLNSYDGYLKEGKDKPSTKPSKKSRDTYVEETFMDWNLPEMTDEEYEKLVDQFDNFLRKWEEKYYKENPIPVVILRKSSADKYSINPTLFVEHKEFFEAHAKWVAVVASDDSGFENLEYLKQLTNVPGYGFTNYHKVLELLKKENKLL